MVTAIVIDDGSLAVKVLCDYLAMIGVGVLGFGYDGKAAVGLYQKHQPDVVFLDIMMPDYDGFYALENIKKINPDAKVVVVTSDLRKETADRLDKLKPTKIIYKPFATSAISEIIEKIKKSTSRG
jgi:DNA-binding NarL/FixJ family response regulator